MNATSDTILIVDDEVVALQIYETALLMEGLQEFISTSDPTQTLALIEHHRPSLLLLDLVMPGISGEMLLPQVADRWPDLQVIIISGTNEAEKAAWCIRHGACDYILKPVDPARLIATIRTQFEILRLRRENEQLHQSVLVKSLQRPEVFAGIVATEESPLQAIFRYIEAVASTGEPVLITGETGTGKELLAKAVHLASGRSGDFVAVNAAGLEDQMFSDTLFGHRKGSYTGASETREGMIRQAEHGTLFLDEIGDLSSTSQVKLLRLIQEGEYYPLGEDRAHRSNACIVAATNLDLAKAVEDGRFRRDLFYRLKTHRVRIPPLRERPMDIPALVDHFLTQWSERTGKPKQPCTSAIFSNLQALPLEGNVRELRSIVLDILSRAEDRPLDAETLAEVVHDTVSSPSSSARQSGEGVLFGKHMPTLAELEALAIKEALVRTSGNRTLAAKMLGISRQTISRLANQPEC